MIKKEKAKTKKNKIIKFEEATLGDKKVEDLTLQDITAERIDQAVAEAIEHHKQEYLTKTLKLPADYKILTPDEVFTMYFYFVNTGSQPVFMNMDDARLCASLIMKSQLANHISYVTYKEIMMKSGTAYILDFCYDNKKEIISFTENERIKVALLCEYLEKSFYDKLTRGDIIIL